MLLAPAESAWLGLVPCALVIVAAIVLLGPALGQAVFPADSVHARFWPYLVKNGSVRPEPTEHARYLLALIAPLLLSGVVVLALRRPWRIRPRQLDRLVQLSQALTVAFLAACLIAQQIFVYGDRYEAKPAFRRAYFTPTTLAVALLIVVIVAATLNRRSAIDRIVALVRETPLRRVVVIAAAVLFTAAWMLTAFNTEGSIGHANRGVYLSLPFWADETFGVLNGRAPMVNFYPQYSQLWPYLAAGLMLLLGTTLGVYSAIMVVAGGLTVLAIFAVLRRVVKHSLVALALYMPIVATGFFSEIGPPENRYAPVNLFSEFPMRYGGPYMLAWLVARRLDGARLRHRFPLFLLAGLVAINNVEFGLPAVGATIAAELWSGGRPTVPSVARLLRDVLLGIAAAVALTSILTLAVSGSLPHFGLLLKFSALYGVSGFGMLPMPTLGFHLVVYATFVAALVVATVRALAREHDVVLTGMLAWTGIFGLGAGSYFVGRSHPEVLIDLFSIWAFALALLLVVAVRALLARPVRRPRLPELAVLAGFALAICSLAQMPTPWSQIARIRHATPAPAFVQTEVERFVAAATSPGAPIAILSPLGHRIAYDIGRTNVSPYVSIESMPTQEQLADTMERLRRAGGRLLFFKYGYTPDEEITFMLRKGFKQIGSDPQVGLIELACCGVPARRTAAGP